MYISIFENMCREELKNYEYEVNADDTIAVYHIIRIVIATYLLHPVIILHMFNAALHTRL